MTDEERAELRGELEREVAKVRAARAVPAKRKRDPYWYRKVPVPTRHRPHRFARSHYLPGVSGSYYYRPARSEREARSQLRLNAVGTVFKFVAFGFLILMVIGFIVDALR